ncbi:hypothetical protein F5Y04DRAFT_120639 [Hypomontagnella monticulosa]|nr:hypothetical protein F5Y04DRAFT_120639 [Hypomontagnella monticulosa]
MPYRSLHLTGLYLVIPTRTQCAVGAFDPNHAVILKLCAQSQATTTQHRPINRMQNTGVCCETRPRDSSNPKKRHHANPTTPVDSTNLGTDR